MSGHFDLFSDPLAYFMPLYTTNEVHLTLLYMGLFDELYTWGARRAPPPILSEKVS